MLLIHSADMERGNQIVRCTICNVLVEASPEYVQAAKAALAAQHPGASDAIRHTKIYNNELEAKQAVFETCGAEEIEIYVYTPHPGWKAHLN